MRRTTPLTVAALLGLALLAPISSAAAAGETCRGEVATIVGTGPTLIGTEGRDVIVTGESGDVFGLGGDDLICVRGSGGNSNLLDVDAGTGDDVVDSTGMRGGYYVDVVLGAGADTHMGGKASESVITGTGDDPMVDVDADTVSTGDSPDTVVTGSASGPNADVVDTGAGRDILHLGSTALAPGGALTGGADGDSLVLDATSGDVSADMAGGTLTTAAGTAAFSSFDRLTLTVGTGTVNYRGTEGSDSLTVHPRTGTPTLDVATGGGDDEIVVEPAVVAAGSRLDAGRGEDTFVTATRIGSVALELGYHRRLSIDGVVVSTADGIENAFVMAPEVTMVGSNADNELTFNGCDATLHGGHGRDSLNNVGDYVFDSFVFDCAATARMYGGPGNDRLRGGSGDDRLDGEGGNDRIEGRGGKDRIRGGAGNDKLDGGEGRDKIGGGAGNDVLNGRAADDVLLGGGGRDLADGSRGRDRCVAERKRRCER